MGLVRLAKRSLKGHTVPAFSYVKGYLGEKRAELLCVGLRVRAVQGTAVGGGGRTWLRGVGCIRS